LNGSGQRGLEFQSRQWIVADYFLENQAAEINHLGNLIRLSVKGG
jgi:hypothetical protein